MVVFVMFGLASITSNVAPLFGGAYFCSCGGSLWPSSKRWLYCQSRTYLSVVALLGFVNWWQTLWRDFFFRGWWFQWPGVLLATKGLWYLQSYRSGLQQVFWQVIRNIPPIIWCGPSSVYKKEKHRTRNLVWWPFFSLQERKHRARNLVLLLFTRRKSRARRRLVWWLFFCSWCMHFTAVTLIFVLLPL